MIKTFFQHQASRVGISILLVLLSLFALVQLAGFLQPNHFLQNLEPYPDGLLYALSARNLAEGRGMHLSYTDSAIPHWVPPLYTLTLSVGYLFSAHPTTFVLTNTLLALATTALIFFIIVRTTKNQVAAVVGVGAYLAHAYIWWLPSLPMSENLSLFLFVEGVASLTILKKPPLIKLVATGICAGALVFTRYAAIGPALALVSMALATNYQKLSKRHILTLGALATLGVGAFSFLVSNPLSLIPNMFTSREDIIFEDTIFYAPTFILPNFWHFLGGLLGKSAPFLWQTTALSSAAFSLWLIASSVLARKFSTLIPETRLLIVLFLAQLPLQLIFYTADSRYIIYSVPLIALAVGWSFSLLSSRVAVHKLLPLSIVLLGVHGFTQLGLFKEVIASNVLGRSTAWQVEAIKQFDRVLPGKSAPSKSAPSSTYLITALPPFLIDAYTTGEYQVLPLSVRQEFLAKSQWVWGSATDPELRMSSPPEMRNPRYTTESLYLIFDELLVQGNSLYISNAYITHQQSVIADYEALKEQYQLDFAASGCQGACDIFRVTQKVTE